MAELADAEDLKSSGLYARAGSSPAPGRIFYFCVYLRIQISA